MKIEMFKAARRSNRFRKNQKVWVRYRFPNHLKIWFKWRGSGRYVSGYIDHHGNTSVGEIKEIEVDENFAKRIRNVT